MFAVTEVVWTNAINGFVALGLAAISVVGVAVGRKLNVIQKTGEATHTLVNSQHGDTLQLNAVVSRRLSAITKLPEDEQAALLAEKLLREHNAKQTIVDQTYVSPRTN